ncbi:DUF4382 domain-containing protein [Natronomonas amylolytica]|uniref:DUF4382 domain-containing protein n=1 Tax=Natronomonas amylolytica TaxID=3108498 RepID=UPI00300895F6
MKLDRRTYLMTTGAATASMVGLAGCLGGSTGTLATRVTDQPGDIADFEECIVTVVGMWLGPEGADSGTEDGGTPSDREYYEYDEPQEADLVQLQDGETQLVDERDLEAGSYEFLQLDTDGVDATLNDGSEATVEVPGEAPLTFNEPFEVREDTRTTFTADFTPVKRGETGSYVLQPVPDGITVDYEDGGGTEAEE